MTAPNVAQIPLEPIVFPTYFTINENPMYQKTKFNDNSFIDIYNQNCVYS